MEHSKGTGSMATESERERQGMGANGPKGDANGSEGAAESDTATGYQLKVLGGRHSGAIMPLPPGRYSLGQDEESDFIFLDDAFLGGQVIIDVTGVIPKLEVTGIVKAAVEGQGVVPGQPLPIDSYQPIEVGATRFAIGPAHLPWPEPPATKAEAIGPDAGPETLAAEGGSVEAGNWPPATPEEKAVKAAQDAKLAKAAARRKRRPLVIAGSVALAGLLGLGTWLILRNPVDPAAVLRGILAELHFSEIKVVPLPGGYLLKGFIQTEADRDVLLNRVKTFQPPVKTRLISAEETRNSITGVLDLYQLDCPLAIGPMGKAVITCVIDNPKTAKEITESVRQGVQSETELEERFYQTGTVYPFVNRMLMAKILDHKIRLEVQKGRVTGVLVKNQMDSLEMQAWNEIRASFHSQFGMDLEERWTERLSPVLMHFNAASRELDSQLVGVTVGELSYITLKHRRKFFEGARLASGLTIKSIQRDRIVLSLDNVEQNYFLKKGAK